MAPILNRIPEAQAKHIGVEHPSTAFAAAFTTNDGFKYDLNHSSCAVGFTHRIRYRNVPGGLPVMDILSQAMPYTKLLPIVCSKLIEAALLLPGVSSGGRTISRVGIVSTTIIDMDTLPPGIRRLVEYMGRPWKGKFDTFNMNLTATITESEDVKDRCKHQIVLPDDKEQPMTLLFDWQRIFSKPRAASSSESSKILDDAQKSALQYFEEIAEGSRFDEDILSKAT